MPLTFGLVGIDRGNGYRRIVRPSAVAYGELVVCPSNNW